MWIESFSNCSYRILLYLHFPFLLFTKVRICAFVFFIFFFSFKKYICYSCIVKSEGIKVLLICRLAACSLSLTFYTLRHLWVGSLTLLHMTTHLCVSVVEKWNTLEFRKGDALHRQKSCINVACTDSKLSPRHEKHHISTFDFPFYSGSVWNSICLLFDFSSHTSKMS